MAVFADRVDAFLGTSSGSTRWPRPPSATTTYDGVWPDLTDAGPGRAAGLHRRLDGRAAGDCRTASLTPDERIDRDLLISELAALRFDEADLREDCLGSAQLRLPARRRHLPAPGPRFRAAGDPAGQRGLAAGGLPAVLMAAARRARHASTAGRSPSSISTWRSSSCPGIGSLADDAVAQAAAAASDPAVAALQPRLEKAAATRASVAQRASARYLQGRRPAASRAATAGWAATSSPASSGTPSAAT